MSQDYAFPTVQLKEESGLLLLSILLKTANPRWGNSDSHLSRMVADYFQFIPFETEFITAVKRFQTAALSEDTLFQLALTYNHPERNQFIFDYLSRQTHFSHDQLLAYRQELTAVLDNFHGLISASPLRQMFDNFIIKDTRTRLKDLELLKLEIGNLYQFFRLNSLQLEFIFTPSDPLFSEYLGKTLILSEHQAVFITHNPALKTQLYQVLRFILHPIVEKISARLNQSQKQKIIQSTSGKLKQFYGYNPQDLLQAELITVFYNNILHHGAPEDFEAFKGRVEGLTSKEFLQTLENNRTLRERCNYLNIHNLTDFKAGLRHYYDIFFKDDLYLVIFKAYQFYQNQQPNITFEQFALLNLPKML